MATNTGLMRYTPNAVIERVSVRVGGEKAKEVERFIKFIMIGAMGAIIDIGLTNFFMKFVFHVELGNNAPVIIASAFGFTAAVTSNFLWNRYWTYPDSRSRSLRRQLAMFFGVNLVGLLIRSVVLSVCLAPGLWLAQHIFADILHYPLTDSQSARLGANFAILVGIAVVMFWNFFINRLWTYNDVN